MSRSNQNKRPHKVEIKRYFAGPGAQYNDQQAEQFGTILERLGDQFSPQDVVDAARPHTSPIHEMFEWNNAVAAENFRVQQARHHVNRLQIRIVKEDGKPELTKSHHSIVIRRDDKSERAYAPASVVFSREDLRLQTIDQAFAELLAIRRKYHHLKELSVAWETIEGLRDAFAKEKATR